MTSRWKKVTAIIIAVFVMVSAIAFAATIYPYAAVSFDGIQLVNNGGTTQGFIDITLKNINAPGFSFCLEYDKTIMELSNIDTNVPVGGETNGLNISHKYFQQNTDIFPEGVFLDETESAPLLSSNVIVNMPIIGITDQAIIDKDIDEDKARLARLRMNFVPNKEEAYRCSYIEDGSDYNIMANTNEGLKIGRISFCIKKPSEFAKLSPKELKEKIKIVPFSNMADVKADDLDKDTGVGIAYMDTDGIMKYYTHNERNIKCDFNIKVEIADVKPQTKEMTVSAYDVYRAGETASIDDLFAFLNENMSDVMLKYADESQVSAKFTWDPGKSTVTGASWDSKGSGNEYTIRQPYNDDITVEVKVKVNPITLTGFEIDNESKTYLSGSANFPQNFEELNLPKKARPIIDTYIPNGGVPSANITWYSLMDGDKDGGKEITELPEDFNSGTPQNYVFIGHIPTDDEQKIINIPWLTTKYPLPDIQIQRNVVTDAEKMPKEIEVESTQTDDNGALTIVVRNKDGSGIPGGTVFDIRMPGGAKINPDELGSEKYQVTFADGKATIVLKPNINATLDETLDPSDEEAKKCAEKEKKLAQLINLGNRAGEFSIASTEPDKNKGEFVKFSTDPRRNVYLPASEKEKEDTEEGTGDTNKEKNYIFDFSTQSSAVFPITAGTSLPTTITLFRSSDRIITTYSGYDGTEKGYLKTFTVNEWDVTDGDTAVEGSIVTATGKLVNASYTNYGEVFNDNDISVTIKYKVLENKGEDAIAPIPDTVYDKRQEGYDYDQLQEKSFIVQNTGPTEIHGLTAVISLSDGSKKEAFCVTRELPQILQTGQSAKLDISTKIGLPVIGDDDFTNYVCTVSIYSQNSKDALQKFNISFMVTKKPVYNIKVTVPEDQKDLGSAKTESEQYTAQEDELVTIVAEPEEDCEFVNWTVVDDKITLADPTEKRVTFSMPGEDIEIEANFKEMLGAKLRAEELYVKDTNNENQKLYKDKWNEIQFDPVKREYYSVVSNDTDKVKLWFKLREEAEGATLELTREYKGVKDTLETPTKDTEDEYFKTQEIELDTGPNENIVELSITHEDPVNHPNEGEVTRKYTIHIYRKIKNSDRMTFKYGNSPYGLIMRDSTLSSEQRDEYKQAFIDNHYMFVEGKTPKDGISGIEYTTKAWNSLNYDLDTSALFVINNAGSSFVDPGYTEIKDSLGNPLEGCTVSKTVKVNLLAETDDALKNGSSEDFIYITPTTFNLPSTGEITVLSKERIRPDCYELTYSFTDFDGSIVSVSRPLIILSPLGDVNVKDGANDVDVYRILHRFSTDIANRYNVPSYEAGGLLFKYRVCDANNDGNLNAIDANRIRKGELNSFYKNLSEGGGS